MLQDAYDVGKKEFRLLSLQVDGGMTSNKLFMQLQANILGCTVCKSREIFLIIKFVWFKRKM